MARKSSVMRVQEETLAALRIYSGELMVKTGRVWSDNETLWEIIKTVRPDIVKRVEKGDYEKDEDS